MFYIVFYLFILHYINGNLETNVWMSDFASEKTAPKTTIIYEEINI